MSFCDRVPVPLTAKNVKQFVQLLDKNGIHVGWVNKIENVHKKNCFRRLYFTVGKRTYIAISTVRNNIENIWHVKPTSYIKVGENIHYFNTTMPRKTRAKSTKKIRLKSPKIGNGEGISQYSLDAANIKVIRITGEYTDEKYCLEYPPKKVVRKANAERTLD